MTNREPLIDIESQIWRQKKNIKDKEYKPAEVWSAETGLSDDTIFIPEKHFWKIRGWRIFSAKYTRYENRELQITLRIMVSLRQKNHPMSVTIIWRSPRAQIA